MKKEETIISSVFGQRFYNMKKWNPFNLQLLVFDGWKYDSEDYKEFDIVITYEGIFTFTDFSEYLDSKIAGGMLFDFKDPTDANYMFFNFDGKRYGNKNIGYEWSSWSPEGHLSKNGISAKNTLDDNWYFLTSYGDIRKE